MSKELIIDARISTFEEVDYASFTSVGFSYLTGFVVFALCDSKGKMIYLIINKGCNPLGAIEKVRKAINSWPKNEAQAWILQPEHADLGINPTFVKKKIDPHLAQEATIQKYNHKWGMEPVFILGLNKT